MSGHSKWATIKRKKGALDAKRGRMFSKVIKEITVAARMGGGDITGNPRLRRAVDDAKAVSMPADNITRAIKKGTGDLAGVAYEEIVYEGAGPSGTLWMIEVLTDNRNRTAPELRKIFDKHNGQLGTSGAAAWAFEPKGVLTMDKEAATEEQLFEIAVGAGAEDVVDDGEEWWIATPPALLETVRSALEASKLVVKTANVQQLAKTPKIIEAHDARICMNLLDTLEDQDDVQKVWSDFEPSEAALAELDA
jgi:YebC/PmpR family DNA-binding regulatory protein